MRRVGPSSNPLQNMTNRSAIETILNRLFKLRDSEIFRVPVDWEGMGLDDYPMIIKSAMDLGTMQTNLSNGVYEDVGKFWEHLELIWSNCEMYNGVMTAYGKIAQKMREQTSRLRKNYNNRSETPPVKSPTEPPKRKEKPPKREEQEQEVMAQPRPVVKKDVVEIPEPLPLEPVSESIPLKQDTASKNASGRKLTTAPTRQTPADPPSEISDPKCAAIAAAVSVRLMSLNSTAMAIIVRYIFNLQMSRTDKQGAKLLRPVGANEASADGTDIIEIYGNERVEPLRFDIGLLEIHELRALFQLVERLIDGGLVHQFDKPATTS